MHSGQPPHIFRQLCQGKLLRHNKRILGIFKIVRMQLVVSPLQKCHEINRNQSRTFGPAEPGHKSSSLGNKMMIITQGKKNVMLKFLIFGQRAPAGPQGSDMQMKIAIL